MKPAVIVLLLGMMGCGGSALPSSSNTVTAEAAAPVEARAKTAIKKPSRDEIERQLEGLAKKAEPDVVGQRDKWVSDTRAEHAKDVAAYQFKASRWGDWLEISIARIGSDGKVQKFSTSINLQLVTTVRLEKGHDPDEAGSVWYGVDYEKDGAYQEGNEWGNCGGGYTDETPGKGYHWRITPEFPSKGYRQLFVETPKLTEQYGMMMSCGPSRIRYKTPNFPEYAADDTIYFDGIATLYAPSGLGETTYRQILSAKDFK